MASPRVHAASSVLLIPVVALLEVWLGGLTVRGSAWMTTLVIFAFGFFIDLDHMLHWQKTKGAIKSMWRDKKINDPVGRYVRAEGRWGANLFHTWPFLVVVLSSCLLGLTPLIAYAVHILVDCCDRGYIGKANKWEIPGVLGKFSPKGWRYGKYH